jgi:hypothetical protein
VEAGQAAILEGEHGQAIDDDAPARRARLWHRQPADMRGEIAVLVAKADALAGEAQEGE